MRLLLPASFSVASGIIILLHLHSCTSMVCVLCNWFFADETHQQKIAKRHARHRSQFPSHPRRSTATDPGVFLQKQPLQKKIWSLWSVGHLTWTIPIWDSWKGPNNCRGSIKLHPNTHPSKTIRWGVLQSYPTLFGEHFFSQYQFSWTIPIGGFHHFPSIYELLGITIPSDSFATDIAPRAPSPASPTAVEWDSRRCYDRCTGHHRCSAGAHGAGRWGPRRRP